MHVACKLRISQKFPAVALILLASWWLSVLRSFDNMVSLDLYCRASGKHWNAETEVQKWKYGNWSTEVRKKATYRCLVRYWLMNVCAEVLKAKVTLSLRCESHILGSRTAAMQVTASECRHTQTKINGEQANYARSMLLMSWQWCRCECCHCSLPKIFANDAISYGTTPEILWANSHCSLRM